MDKFLQTFLNYHIFKSPIVGFMDIEMGIESEISMEGTLSDFEFEFITKQKMQQTTKISSSCAESETHKKRRKDKIKKLQEQLKQCDKNFDLTKMKLEYFVSSLSHQIDKRGEEVKFITSSIQKYSLEISEGNKDIKDIYLLREKTTESKQVNKSIGSQASFKPKNIIKKDKSPNSRPKLIQNKHKSTQHVSYNSTGKEKHEKTLGSKKQSTAPFKKKSPERLKSISNEKKQKLIKNFIF